MIDFLHTNSFPGNRGKGENAGIQTCVRRLYFQSFSFTSTYIFMAINTITVVIISGAASATLATAVSNYNTAVATLYANAGSAIWNPKTPGPTPGPAGMSVAPDAAVANDKYNCWGQFTYLSAS